MRVLHFVQSIEPLQGGGLGQAALGLHLAMRSLCPSKIVATRDAEFQASQPDLIQCVRKGLPSIYYSPALHQVARDLVKETDWIHGHGLYVGTNWIFGAETIKQHKRLCYHTHGFFDPWILNRSAGLGQPKDQGRNGSE